MEERHGIRGFARGKEITRDELGAGVNGEPEPLNTSCGSEFGADFIELEDLWAEVTEKRWMVLRFGRPREDLREA